jgi:hypothetical protein
MGHGKQSGRSRTLATTTTYNAMPLACELHYLLRRRDSEDPPRDGTMLCVDWRSQMLRVEFLHGETVTMRLEGRFVGPFAEDTKDLLTRCKIPQRLVVNLSEVTFVDAVGEEMLSWLARIGGKFVADNCYPLHVCERLHLPMAPKRAGVFSQAM